ATNRPRPGLGCRRRAGAVGRDSACISAAVRARGASRGPYICVMTGAEGGAGRLLVCATPIGNLGDVTLRVLDALGEADAIACEDTRHTRVLLERYSLTAPLVSLHEHNEGPRSVELLARIVAGETIALVSDAGMPLISDPGFVLVRACLQEGVAVDVLPGPSAVTTALVASGLPSDRWLFAGFLPRKRAELTRL